MNIDAIQRWLNEHCSGRADICAAVVVRIETDTELAPCAGFPDTTAPATAAALVNVAREAIKRGSPLTLVPAVVQKDAGYTRMVAVPVRGGDTILGAAALAVRPSDGAVAKRLQEELERVSPALAVSMQAPPAPAREAPSSLMQCQDLVAGAESFDVAARKIADFAVREGRFERVSVGWMPNGPMRLLAMSGNDSTDDRQDLVRALTAAMEECADQGKTILHPSGMQGETLVTHMHAKAAERVAASICTVPLRLGDVVLGAIMFERKGEAGMVTADRDWCDGLARATGPLLALKQEAERTWWRRMADGLRNYWQGRGQRWQRVAMAVGALALLGLCLLPVTFEVGAPARIEGVVQRVLAAPVDGFLRQTRVRPGDSVKRGDVLVELADQDLLLEKKRWESELARHQNNFSLALGKSDRAQFAVNFARAAEARAQLDLVEGQIARAQVVAPIDGLVIQGDLTQSVGAPVKRGDTLMTVAPRDQYRIIVEVDERDIGFLRLGQKGRLALTALPGERLHFTVQRITPVAAVTRDGRNAFDVEGRLEEGSLAPRHGLQGVARIDTERRTLAWILTRRVLGWLRLSIWSWAP